MRANAGSLTQQSALRRLPNVVVIGVSKAGTTSLFEYLGTHPDVGLSDRKELRYFTPLRYGEPLEPLTSYTEHFRHCLDQRYAVEATPGYFYGGRPLARAMRQTCGPVRVVLSLREPGDRCWSWFRFVKSRLRIPKDLSFENYLSRCEQLHIARTDAQLEHQPYWGLGGGCYSDWLGEWIEEFGDDLKLVFFDDLVRNPRALLEELFDWLGLDVRQASTAGLGTSNKTQQYRNGSVQKAAVAVNRHGEAFFRRHPQLKRGMRGAYYRINKAAAGQTMTPASRERLDRFFQPYNSQLGAELARLGLVLPKAWT
jgi:uncharacterized short protein YbdD (DUF466 family)